MIFLDEQHVGVIGTTDQVNGGSSDTSQGFPDVAAAEGKIGDQLGHRRPDMFVKIRIVGHRCPAFRTVLQAFKGRTIRLSSPQYALSDTPKRRNGPRMGCRLQRRNCATSPYPSVKAMNRPVTSRSPTGGRPE